MVPLCLKFANGEFKGIFWLWGNDEEGVPEWWMMRAKRVGGIRAKLPNWWWYAIRNPVNNFRFLFDDREAKRETNWNFDLPMEPQNLLDAGLSSAYMWSYSGIFASYRLVWLGEKGKYSEFWIGWKVGSPVPGMGFTTQLRLKRDIGT